MLAKIRSKWTYLAIAALLVFLALVPFDWFLGEYKFLMIL